MYAYFIKGKTWSESGAMKPFSLIVNVDNKAPKTFDSAIKSSVSTAHNGNYEIDVITPL